MRVVLEPRQLGFDLREILVRLRLAPFVEALRQALIEGEESGGDSPLDMDEIRREARKEAGLDA